ncbi:CBS domain-containing protein (plasmid) [Streptomyces sp. NBC_01340]|uniref:CBS domain-containing protein n=1 Tax=Streptomyces sp. NBC_01340 TaxID=2903830 RepID=UPI002E1043BF|nr:CBS domain-containing protein [Streptomyces sp. NBC_01340]
MNEAPYSISEDETLLMAWEVVERSGQRHLPVVRHDGCCAGVLDRAELAVACADPARCPAGRARPRARAPHGHGPSLGLGHSHRERQFLRRSLLRAGSHLLLPAHVPNDRHR